MEKNKSKKIGGIKNNKGITLLALAVTIVVLLILTSVGIKLALGNNGIIGEAKNAKELAEIDEEKGIVKRATTVSLIKSKGAKVEQDTLEKALNDETGEGKTEVNDVGDVFEVVFVDSNRYYEVNEEGNISEVNKITKDDYAGDITKGGRYDGSEENPYEISCIEDLVVLSIMVNGGNTDLGIAKNNFSSKNVVLTRSLNFNSRFSYNDSTTTKFGDLNEDGIIENIKTELTKTDENCIGFKPIGINEYGDYRFFGALDGKNNEIKNIYIKSIEDAGLFGNTWGAVISNLTISGKITSTQKNAGGIAGKINGGSSIENCHNKAIVRGASYVGGICGDGWATNNVVSIRNCTNSGEVYSDNRAGGIVGGSSGEVIGCYNKGNVSGVYYSGGIAGQSRQKLTILNCYNTGKIIGTTHTGTAGIVAHVYEEVTVNNCYNTGNISSNSKAYGIGGTTITNCYNFGKLTANTGINTIGGKNVNSCYYKSSQKSDKENTEEGAIDVENKSIEEIVALLNSYKDDTGAYPDGWKKWKKGDNGYPTFSD